MSYKNHCIRLLSESKMQALKGLYKFAQMGYVFEKMFTNGVCTRPLFIPVFRIYEPQIIRPSKTLGPQFTRLPIITFST